MQTTLRINDAVYRDAKAEAARRGITLTRFIEDALRERIGNGSNADQVRQAEIDERDRLMELLLKATAHFKIGAKPTREEMHER
jgi:hypothetical protein